MEGASSQEPMLPFPTNFKHENANDFMDNSSTNLEQQEIGDTNNYKAADESELRKQ